MIGDGWDGEPAVRPGEAEASDERRRRIAVVTGSRADYGLLRPVMRAIDASPGLELLVVAAGAHLLHPALTYREVRADFPVADVVPMQDANSADRTVDVQALGRGVSRFGRAFEHLEPGWVVVLGDRIEAFAAASAASVGGWALAHVHGGDRAEGVADEAMRHAITKLSHLHFAASEASAERIRRMGERPEHVHVVGSPALDGLGEIAPLDERAWEELGSPEAVFLMHPLGRHAEEEEHAAAAALEALRGRRVLALSPNSDAGRHGIARAIEQSGVRAVEHIRRDRFVALLKRLAASGGLLVGNSSAGLIEGAAIGLAVVDIGRRQAGRERAANVVHAGESVEQIAAAMERAAALDLSGASHPWGEGRAGEGIARVLSKTEIDSGLIRKRCVY